MTTQSNMGWYDGLEKSTLTPPDIAFPIVWTSLYVMLAVAAYLVWKNFKSKGFSAAFILFWAQMLMNWVWSFVFFEFHMVTLAFYWICVLNLLMIGFIIIAWKDNKWASILVIPTVLWGSFAAYLNYSIMILN